MNCIATSTIVSFNREVPSYTWLNRSITKKTTYNFTNLKPATIYYLFVSVKVSNATGSFIYSPVHFVSVKTNDGGKHSSVLLLL